MSLPPHVPHGPSIMHDVWVYTAEAGGYEGDMIIVPREGDWSVGDVSDNGRRKLLFKNIPESSAREIERKISPHIRVLSALQSATNASHQVDVTHLLVKLRQVVESLQHSCGKPMYPVPLEGKSSVAVMLLTVLYTCAEGDGRINYGALEDGFLQVCTILRNTDLEMVSS